MAISNLNPRDCALWLEAITQQPNDSPQMLLEWIKEPLRRFFPFDKALLIHAELTMGQIAITHVLSFGHEERYLKQLSPVFDLEDRGALRWWLENQMPFGIDTAAPPAFASNFEIAEIEEFNLGRIAAHGIVDIKANTGTYFSFAGIPNSLNQWHWDALRLLTPVLNDLFLSHIRNQKKPPAAIDRRLTDRQRQIARYVIKGLGNKAIAREMNIAEKTVRNQLAEIFRKLHISKRGELAAMLR